MVVLNVLNFFKMYAPENINVNQAPQSTTVLQTWVRERMNQTVVQVDDLLDQYKIFEASRTLEVLLDDISRWYLRRSRVLFQKPESSESLNRQAAFLGYLLLDLARLMAPFTPFLAEQIWQEVVLRLKRQDPGDKWADSVHLDKWPEARLSRNAGKLFADMALVRNIAAAGLALRAQAGIKARQPLSVFYIQAKEKILSKELLLVLSDEMNVKQVEVVGEVPVSDTIKSITQENITVGLETLVSSELKAEGDDRELMRQINEGRQEQSCAPNDKVKASVPGSLIPEGFFDNSDRLLKVQTLTNSTITVVEDIKEIRIEKII
jgi:isoleucyl-tRNA synthetase